MANAMDIDKECCLCLQIFTDPRVLPCRHTFCLRCLEKMGATISNDWMLCPVCGAKFTVPGEGVIGLPKNIFADKFTDVRSASIFNSADNPSCDACAKVDFGGDGSVAEKYCINCEDKLCLKCCTEHQNGQEHLIVDLNCQKKTKTERKQEEEEEGEVEKVEVCRCRVHKDETPKHFCTFCKKVICNKCFHESHESHNCSDLTDIVSVVFKQAEKECSNVENMQHKFQDKKETLHREQMKFLEKIKKMETEILQRCEDVKELVVKETKTLLQELAVLKTERLEEIEMEHRRLDKHICTLEKFKEYCVFIKRNGALNYTCEAESILRSTADELRIREKSRIESRIIPLECELQKTEIPELLIPLSNAIGKINVTCPYKMEQPATIDTNGRTIRGLASLQDKLYLLSDSVLIHRAESPYDCVGEIKIPDIKSPISILSCSQTSRLYIYDKDSTCIWKVSVPDHQVTRWFDNVRLPCRISVTHNGEMLLTTQNKDLKQPVTVAVYNQNAILTERIELPKVIQSLIRVYKTLSGNFIGFGEQSLYKFRADGSIVSQSDVVKYPDIGGSVRCLVSSTYQVFVLAIPSPTSWGYTVSLTTSDLAFHRSLLGCKDKEPISACYVKATNRLAVLECAQFMIGKKMEAKQIVTLYSLI